MIRIASYEDKYYDSLLEFSQKVWPNKTEDYLRYRLYDVQNGKRRDLNILLLDDEKVVGCNLFFPTKAMINGAEEEVCWGHDIFIDKEYRGDWGMELFLTAKNVKNTWGLGLSAIAKKITGKLRYVSMPPMVNYIGCTVWTIKYALQKIGFKNKGIKEIVPENIKIGNNVFSLIDKSDRLKIPNDGYWNKERLNIDFIRDKEFLDTRFFGNFNTYYLYKLENGQDYDSCYFVFRFIKYKNTDFVSLIDYRYDTEKPEQFADTVKALRKIALINKAPFYDFNTTQKIETKKISLLVFQSNGYTDIVTNNKKISPDENVIITKADSDKDFCTS